jgi:hypothetical protein
MKDQTHSERNAKAISDDSHFTFAEADATEAQRDQCYPHQKLKTHESLLRQLSGSSVVHTGKY